MKKIYGNIVGLKTGQLKRLDKLTHRRVPPDYIIPPELARDVVQLSDEIRRQIGLLINRAGSIIRVIIGDHQKIVIPDTSEFRFAPGRLKGLRCVHTHLKDESLTVDDLMDLALLRLDLMAAITMTAQGLPYQIHMGNIHPGGSADSPYQIHPPLLPHQLDIGCLGFVLALESEMAHIRALYDADQGIERALLVSVTTHARSLASDSLDELSELAESSDISVIDRIIQQRKKIDARFLMGRGKLTDLSLSALQKGITLIIMDQELNPSQMRSITDQIDLKIIDRTQLILDIFAKRAQSREGKLQVELAQLKYLLPRLITQNTAMSRLTGGIGGRGPGETKLEINRRRIRDRIVRLDKEIGVIRKQRAQQKAQRKKKGLPVISIIGYTNAGKSTLLNTLTQSHILAENRMFATLDPSSRRLRFPRDIEVIITDTVGFIRDLPKELMSAFRATLEELESADLLLHVIDISNPRCEAQINSVENILSDLDLDHIPSIYVLNKMDLVATEPLTAYKRRYDGIAVSARNATTLMPLFKKMEAFMHDLTESST